MRHSDGEETSPEYQGRISQTSDQQYGRASINLTDVQESDRGLYRCDVRFPNRNPSKISPDVFYQLDIEGEFTAQTIQLDDTMLLIASGESPEIDSTVASISSTDLSTDGEVIYETIGPPRNLTIHLNTGGYLLSWSPPVFGLERLRLYVVRMFRSPSKYLVSSSTTQNNHFISIRLRISSFYDSIEVSFAIFSRQFRRR
jgi:hypothetical protein